MFFVGRPAAYLRSLPPSSKERTSLADTGMELLRFLVPLADAVKRKRKLVSWRHETGWKTGDVTA